MESVLYEQFFHASYWYVNGADKQVITAVATDSFEGLAVK